VKHHTARRRHHQKRVFPPPWAIACWRGANSIVSGREASPSPHGAADHLGGRRGPLGDRNFAAAQPDSSCAVARHHRLSIACKNPLWLFALLYTWEGHVRFRNWGLGACVGEARRCSPPRWPLSSPAVGRR
jgi:hypothetical protein